MNAYGLMSQLHQESMNGVLYIAAVVGNSTCPPRMCVENVSSGSTPRHLTSADSAPHPPRGHDPTLNDLLFGTKPNELGLSDFSF